MTRNRRFATGLKGGMERRERTRLDKEHFTPTQDSWGYLFRCSIILALAKVPTQSLAFDRTSKEKLGLGIVQTALARPYAAYESMHYLDINTSARYRWWFLVSVVWCASFTAAIRLLRGWVSTGTPRPSQTPTTYIYYGTYKLTLPAWDFAKDSFMNTESPYAPLPSCLSLLRP